MRISFANSRIKQLFLEKLNRAPKDTEVQKTAVDVANACNLKIPMGWYLFGLITVMRYDNKVDYNSSLIDCPPEKVDQEILMSIENCKKITYVRELAKRQYEIYGELQQRRAEIGCLQTGRKRQLPSRLAGRRQKHQLPLGKKRRWRQVYVSAS